MAKHKYQGKKESASLTPTAAVTPKKGKKGATAVAQEKEPTAKKTFTNKQKIIVICLCVVLALALVAGIVVVSLYATGAFEKEGAALRVRDADNGFKKYYVTGEGYPGTYAVMTLNDGEKDYEIEILLLAEYAPKTVNNFIQYAEENFYDGTVIHRIVPGTYTFQGGGYVYQDSSYTKKVATHDPVVGEFRNNTSGNYSYNTISHFAGSISMARQGAAASSTKAVKESAYNSATSEFFISWNNYPTWDGDYAAFGFIVDNEDVRAIKEIAEKAELEDERPTSPITVTKVTIKSIPESK